ncbi:hypothetical protein BT96DRAFT_411415 [Gymnopus androsaceus JB14]|uniref:Uncharacterized protein n=1 Tax=Gymnopus androsaceus JB14 TaxID=1447944 RepID=A0A6A4I6C5_9AGAR|nr:hypothetical protein BT96DRAFT_411415 [Gymnopus androsaceus JB14]
MNPNANDHWNTNMNSYGLGTPINPFNGTADSQPMIPITLASPDQYTPYFSNFSLNSKTYYPNLHRDFRDNNHGPSASGSSNHNGRTSDNGWNTRTAHNTNSASITGSGSSSTGPAGGSETDGDGTRNGINNNRKFPSRRASTRGSKNSFPNPHVRHSTHPSQTFRKNNTRPQVTKGDGITHAEDLQPNEGFTGVKTTRAHQAVVPKVLSSSSNSSRGGRGMSQRGNWRGQHRGNVWKSRNHGGSSRHSAPLFPTSGSEELSESTPIPSTPHHVPSTALTKALNNNFVIPQKRKSPEVVGCCFFPDRFIFRFWA